MPQKIALNIILQLKYVFSEKKQEILKLHNGQIHAGTVYSMMSQMGGLNMICFNELSWVYDVILTTFMLVPNTYL